MEHEQIRSGFTRRGLHGNHFCAGNGQITGASQMANITSIACRALIIRSSRHLVMPTHVLVLHLLRRCCLMAIALLHLHRHRCSQGVTAEKRQP